MATTQTKRRPHDEQPQRSRQRIKVEAVHDARPHHTSTSTADGLLRRENATLVGGKYVDLAFALVLVPVFVLAGSAAVVEDVAPAALLEPGAALARGLGTAGLALEERERPCSAPFLRVTLRDAEGTAEQRRPEDICPAADEELDHCSGCVEGVGGRGGVGVGVDVRTICVPVPRRDLDHGRPVIPRFVNVDARLVHEILDDVQETFLCCDEERRAAVLVGRARVRV